MNYKVLNINYNSLEDAGTLEGYLNMGWEIIESHPNISKNIIVFILKEV